MNPPSPARPRLGFLGLGWIGLDRMKAIAATQAVEIVAIAEPSDEAAAHALDVSAAALRVHDLDALLDLNLDGVVIATPSALHAEQALASLRRGCAVFCQKPLGRNAAEVAAVIEAARNADRLLAVDLSYRFTAGMQAIKARIEAGELGRIYAVDLVFHNAYGPDKPWFRDRALSGGGCVIDLGVHLVDLALWTLGFPEVTQVSSHLFAGGEPLPPGDPRVEDYAVATLTLATGAVARLACSWNLPAGCDAVIEAAFYGTSAAATMRNVAGAFTDFEAVLTTGSSGKEPLAAPPDSWTARAAASWAHDLARSSRFRAEAQEYQLTATVLDRIYRVTTPG